MKNLLNKKTVIIISGCFVAVVVLVLFGATYFVQTPTPQNQPPPEPTSYILKKSVSIPSLQKTTIGKTTVGEIESLPGISKTSESDYSYSSYLLQRPNEIKTENNTASFERVLTPISSSDPNYTTIPKIIEMFGKADKITTGSKFYGDYLNTYIYATQGMAFVGNPNTNEVYEIQFFKPMTPDEYESKFGQDISNNLQPATESHGQ